MAAPQTAVFDRGKDQVAATTDVVDQFNQMFMAMRNQIRSLETRVAMLEGRLGASAPTITGSRLTGAAGENLLIGLDTIGLIIDSTTA